MDINTVAETIVTALENSGKMPVGSVFAKGANKPPNKSFPSINVWISNERREPLTIGRGGKQTKTFVIVVECVIRTTKPEIGYEAISDALEAIADVIDGNAFDDMFDAFPALVSELAVDYLNTENEMIWAGAVLAEGKSRDARPNS